MSWRDKLHVECLGSGDKSDRTPTFVTSVTGPVNANDEVSSGVTIRPEPPESACEPEFGIPWAEWKAAALNQLFMDQGATGHPGRITAATVRHGEAGRERVDSAAPGERPMSRAEAPAG